MPRLVRVFEPTWQDRYFRKAVEKLSPREREERAGQAASLVKALQTCSHPVLDPRLQTWRPSSYRGVIQAKDAYLVEYRITLIRIEGLSSADLISTSAQQIA